MRRDPYEVSLGMVSQDPPFSWNDGGPAPAVEAVPSNSHDFNYPPILSIIVTRGPILTYAKGTPTSEALPG